MRTWLSLILSNKDMRKLENCPQEKGDNRVNWFLMGRSGLQDMDLEIRMNEKHETKNRSI